MKKLNVALVGLGFGGAFAGIYKEHPNVGELTLFDTKREIAEQVSAHIGGAKIADSFEAILADSSIDAVHLVTPIPLHADQTMAVLESGKHCACTVPTATSIEDIRRIVEAKRKSGKNYMMMETTLYTYQYFYAAKMKEEGRFGKIQFFRGSHYQDMANWPSYWMGLPPMWYGTHAIGPMVALSGSRICRVNCFGSGTMEKWLHEQYGNPFPIESALFEFESGIKGEATRSLFECARIYQEGMFIYGSDACFEWGFADHDDPYITIFHPAQGGKRGGGLEQCGSNSHAQLLRGSARGAVALYRRRQLRPAQSAGFPEKRCRCGASRIPCPSGSRICTQLRRGTETVDRRGSRCKHHGGGHLCARISNEERRTCYRAGILINNNE